MSKKEIRVLSEEGKNFVPATVTDAILHEQTGTTITKLFGKYNATVLWPLKSGNSYTLDTAITTLGGKLSDSQKVLGVIVEFTDSSGNYEEWEYFGGGYEFTNILGWREIDSSIILELQHQLFPLTTSLSASTYLIQTKTSSNVIFTWHAYRKGTDVTSSATVVFNGSTTTEIGTTITLNESAHTSKSYTMSAVYQGLTSSSSCTVNVVDPSYYGIVDDGVVPSATLITGNFTQRLGGSKSFGWDNISMTNQKTCFAYPSYFGSLSSIKDGNNFEYINSYTMSTLSIGGITYNVYILTKPTTITGFKQTYS